MADQMDIDIQGQGTKRKIDQVEEPASQPRRIQALDPDVINKIAAGEIIVAPVHALKELIENAVDAGSTALEVLVKDGGLKLLQVSDNGCGIQKEDLAILCERHTTSKLQKFEDLSSIATYGFRGEALASISHIAHLTVTTKTKESAAAYRAHYDGGKLAPAKPGQSVEPKPVAGRPGTQITVEDLFYNVPTRKRAFRSASDEYNKIIDMVGRYAIHCAGVAFSCKKHGEASTSISVPATATVVDRIRQIYGGSVASELIDFDVSNNKWAFKAEGWATNANYNIKKTTLLLFINHRSVESTNIRRAVEQTYSAFLPKNGHPFVYLSLEIDPSRVDVNVHPTKKEVNFLNEDEIIQAVCEHIRTKLAAVDTSRTFMTQTLLPGGLHNSPDPRRRDSDSPVTPASAGTKKTPSRPYENNLVRTDTNLRKITSMFTRAPPTPHPGGGSGAGLVSTDQAARGSVRLQNGPSDAILYETSDAQYAPCKLSSVHELRAVVREDMHHELIDIFANHTFVGIVDERRRLVAMQGGVKLYLVDYGRVCFEYLYQIGLTDFGNFGTIVFSPPLDLRELLHIAAEPENDPGSSSASPDPSMDKAIEDLEEELQQAAGQLIAVREMMLEYFSLEITPTGDLVSIPLLVKGYQPALFKLPCFLLNLARKVPWDAEKPCFEGFLRELATFYVPEQLPPPIVSSDTQSDADAGSVQDGEEAMGEGGQQGDSTIEARREHVRWAVEHIFFPAFKARLVGTRGLLNNGGLTEVSDLKVMYRVFERC